MTELRSYEEIGAANRQLTEAFDAGQLTVTMLAEAITVTAFAGYETMPSSVGLDWLHGLFEPIDTEYMLARYRTRDDEYDKIREIIAHRDTQLSDLIAKLPNMTRVFVNPQTVGSSWSTSVLCSTRLFGLIDEALRGNFFRMVLARHNPGTNWVRAALDVGLSSNFLAGQVTNKLMEMEIDPERSSSTNFVTDFLSDGAWRDGDHYWEETSEGRKLRRVPSVWSLFTMEELARAMEICASKVPGELLSGRGFNEPALVEKLEQHLDAERVRNLLISAINNLGSLNGVSWVAFSRLNPLIRMRLLEKFSTNSIELLVWTAADLPKPRGEAFFMQKVTDVARRAQHDLRRQFIRLQPVLDEMEEMGDRELATKINQTIVGNLRSLGYRVGTIEKGVHPRGGAQYQVRLEHGRRYMTYVQNNDGFSRDRYFPVEGDLVIFSPENGRKLTTTVTAVTFERVREAEKHA